MLAARPIRRRPPCPAATRGHFTGTHDGTAGEGQPIRFGAIDVQHLGNGATITGDWHPEGNLTFLQQTGIVPTS